MRRLEFVSVLALLAFVCSCICVVPAFANYENPTNYNVDYIEQLALANGMTANEFVVTYIASSQIASGYQLTDDFGISYGDTLENNLSHVASTDNYPSWNQLSSALQNQWNSAINYDAARWIEIFNNGSGGRGTYESYEGSGGGNLDYDTVPGVLKTAISKIGSIARNWISGNGNSYDDVTSIFGAEQNTGISNLISVMIPSNAVTVSRDSLGLDSNSGFPENITILKTTSVSGYSYNATTRKYTIRVCETNRPVYCIAQVKNGHVRNNTSVMYADTNPFYYGSAQSSPEQLIYPLVNANSLASETSFDNVQFYLGGVTISGGNYQDVNPFVFNQPANYVDNIFATNAVFAKLFSMDFSINTESREPMEDYPEEQPAGNTVVYYPTNGINPSITWIDYTTAPGSGEDNPGDSTTGVDLSEIVSLLQRNNVLLERFKFASQDLKVADLVARQTLSEILAALQGNTGTDLTGVRSDLSDIESDLEDVYRVNNEMWYSLTIINSLLQDIKNLISLPSNADSVIGDFDFQEYKSKSADLEDALEVIMPFAGLFWMQNIMDMLASGGDLDDPVFVFDFDFFPGSDASVSVDLRFLELVKPIINFFLLAILVMSLGRATMRFIEVEVI